MRALKNYDNQVSREQLQAATRIHLVGIGGIGMSGLALLLSERGFEISGSDIKISDNIKYLRQSSIEVHLGHNSKNIDKADIICYSSAITADNPELIAADNSGIPIIKRGELLALLTQDFKTIAVSGSHGKTTTSSLISFIFRSMGFNPYVFVGGYLRNFNSCAWGGEDFFVVETDESDGSFLFCNPWVSVITNIDYEHIDFYKDIKALKQSFNKFAANTKKMVIGCGDDSDVQEIMAGKIHLSYGVSDINYIQAKNIRYQGLTSSFDLLIEGQFFCRVKIPLLGEHNVVNVLAAVSLFYFLDFDLTAVISKLNDFAGVSRRMDIKKICQQPQFIDDYAHHPGEIRSVTNALRQAYPDKRLIAIFQPHRHSRFKLLYQEFLRCFDACDLVVTTDIYAAGEYPLEGVNVQAFTRELNFHFKGEVVYSAKTDLINSVPLLLDKDDLVLSLGAGDINKIADKIALNYINNR
jgi:UDP-N-acetylmuramate--alanine ligase